MSKTITSIILMILSAVCCVSFAQDFNFIKPSPITSSGSSSSSLPKREQALSPQGFANSSNNAYQTQQAKVAAIASQKMQENQANQAAALPSTPGAAQKPASTIEQLTKEPPKPITSPSISGSPTPRAAPPPPQSTPEAVQPYTGFQSSPSSSGASSPPPSNNQNQGGWGSSIKY